MHDRHELSELVIIRHGESEGNLALRASEQGNESFFTEEFGKRHNSRWRLTDQGIEQAKSAGVWVGAYVGLYFDGYYTSEFVRAEETAYHLLLPDNGSPIWEVVRGITERDWGDFDGISIPERERRYSEAMERRERNAFYWHPPGGGESMAELEARVNNFYRDLRHCHCGERVIIVAHGEVMWALRIILEGLTHTRFMSLHRADGEKIHNCQILHYRWSHPITQKKENRTLWMRSVCPWIRPLQSPQWRAIKKPLYTNAELLERVQKNVRLIS